MMCARVMFALVIRKILLTRVPVKCVHILCTFITNPEKSHFHGTRALAFDSAICNAHGSCIIAMYWSFGLWMAHIFQDAAKNNTRLAIVK
jgi:hypothetical protein